MTPGLHIALSKPEYGVRGGFESVVDRVVGVLEDDGHRVSRIEAERPWGPRRVRGLEPDERRWKRNPEFLGYAALMEDFEAVDASGYDMVLSTQPPSFAVSHPRHLSLFFHHQRVYYDLADDYVDAGFAHPEIHARSAAALHAMDRPHLEAVTGFLAGSQVVAERLHRFQGIDAIGVFHAGIEGAADARPRPLPERPAALCVSRQEFPKRTELFVVAMKHLADVTGHLVGGGGRLPWVRELDARLTAGQLDPDALTEHDLWRNLGHVAGDTPARGSNLHVWGRVDDARLAELFDAATCVVAPALDEDYGLTALEAMRVGRPVVVCDDGGGLTELVRDGVDGLVVPPRPRAIAEAVRSLVEDRDRAREMGAAGAEAARQYTWERAAAELRAGVERVMS